MKILLDGVDITAEILAQADIPNLSGGIYPDSGTRWYNLIPIVAKHPELESFFSKGGLHKLSIQGDAGYEFEARAIFRICYAARNS